MREPTAALHAANSRASTNCCLAPSISRNESSCVRCLASRPTEIDMTMPAETPLPPQKKQFATAGPVVHGVGPFRGRLLRGRNGRRDLPLCLQAQGQDRADLVWGEEALPRCRWLGVSCGAKVDWGYVVFGIAIMTFSCHVDGSSKLLGCYTPVSPVEPTKRCFNLNYHELD